MDLIPQFRMLSVIVVIVCCYALVWCSPEHESPPATSDIKQNPQDPDEADPQAEQQDVPTPDKQEKEKLDAAHDASDASQGPIVAHDAQGNTLTNERQVQKESVKSPTVPDDLASSRQAQGEDVAAQQAQPDVGKDQEATAQVRAEEQTPNEADAGAQNGPTEPATPSTNEAVRANNNKESISSPEGNGLGTQNGEETGELPPSSGAGKDEGEPAAGAQGTSAGESPQDVTTAGGATGNADHKPDGQQDEANMKAKPAERLSQDSSGDPITEEKMPSFDEWKQTMLAEQKQAQAAKHSNGHAFQPVSGTVSKPKQKASNRVNYASSSCGAKLIAANPEAKNSGFILTENKDQYMIQPCQAKKWFVLELCELVSVQTLEVANLELFSSLPESFVVHISERYPTKEWKMLGTFRAREERTIQSFPVMDEEMFAKFIKVEPLTHYGNEHYCPLTILRVYGTNAVEDDEDAEPVDSGPDDDDNVQEEPANMFSSATDTVISMVKNVLNPGDTKNGVVQMNGTGSNESVTNATAAESVRDQTDPCIPTVTTGAGSKKSDNCVLGKPQPETPTVSDIRPVVTLIESRPHVATTISDLVDACNFCQHLIWPSCYANRAHICGYYRVTNFVLDTTCVPVKLSAKRVVKPKIEKGFAADGKGKNDNKDMPPAASGSPGNQQLDDSIPKEAVNGQIDDNRQKEQSEARKALNTERGVPGAAPNTEQFQPSSSLLQKNAKQPTPTLKASMSETTFENLSDSLHTEIITNGATIAEGVIQTKPVADSCNPSQSDCSVMGPDIVQIRPTTTDEAVMPNVESMDQSVTISATKATNNIQAKQSGEAAGPGSQGAGAINEATVINANQGNGKERVIHAELPLQDPGYDLEKLALPDDGEPVQKLSTGRRETAFVKLKNRIKELELNLNLSSRYLEELSQRYRRQMENMYPTLNKTIQRLINNSRIAEQRDLRQQANITDLMKNIKTLTQQTQQLTQNYDNLQTQVIERHLFLMMVEGIVFLLLITWVLNRIHEPPRRIRQVRTVEQLAASSHALTKLPPPPPPQNSKPLDKNKKFTHHKLKRRNSIDGTPPRRKPSSLDLKQTSKDDIGLRLSGSETSIGTEALIAASAAATAAANTEFKEIVNRKKKKKRQNKLLPLSHSLTSIPMKGARAAQVGSSNSNVHPNIGLVFTSKVNSLDPSPPHSPTSSESGDSGVGQAIKPFKQVSNNRHNKVNVRRSLDLQAVPVQTSSGSNIATSRKSHKRQRSDGAIHTQNHNVTNIGAMQINGQSDITTWRGWFGGTRK